MSAGAPPPGAAARRRGELAVLRARVRALESGGRAQGARAVPLGAAALDRHLPGGGLPLAGLHEVEGERAEWDDGAATGFVLALLARLAAAAPGRAPVLWAGRWGDLHAPGLAAFGLDPGGVILVRARAEADVLWAMEEGLRCPGLGAVVGEAEALDRTAGRRLQLAAEAGGRPALLLRRRVRAARGGAAPSAAATRWRVAPAPSRTVLSPAGAPLSGPVAARLPGRPRWRVELLRCRGAAPGQWLVEWDDATGGFALAAALRDRPLAPVADARAGEAAVVRLAG